MWERYCPLDQLRIKLWFGHAAMLNEKIKKGDEEEEEENKELQVAEAKMWPQSTVLLGTLLQRKVQRLRDDSAHQSYGTESLDITRKV